MTNEEKLEYYIEKFSTDKFAEYDKTEAIKLILDIIKEMTK